LFPAVTLVVLAGCGGGGGGPRTKQAGGTGDATTSTTFRLAGMDFRPGDCVIWDQQAGLAFERSSKVVPCEEPHFFEVAGRLNLAHLAAYPSVAEWKEINENRDCPELAERYFGYPLDPDGRFDATGMDPYPESWAAGERYVWCGLAATPSAANDDPKQHDPMTGRAKGQDQTRLWGTGACLAEDVNHQIVGTVPCTAPHVYEVVGAVTVGTRWTAPPPASSSEWGRVLGSDCAAKTRTYFAGAVPPGVLSNVLPFRAESWNAGRRTAECVAARLDSANRPMTLTASLRPAG
jgi:hypothetical protein